MLIRGTTPASCFGLAGCDENAGTSALGWCLDRSPALRREILGLLGVDPALDLVVASQLFAEDRGFTDLELTAGTRLHVIFEAKLGWRVPTLDQLKRYIPRLAASSAQHRRLVSVSAADRTWAKGHLPTEIDDVPVSHLSWTDLQRAASRAKSETRGPIERLWLDQLIEHLKGYGMTSKIFDARAYVVSLIGTRVKSDDPLSWLDVVTQQGRYFHPVGGTSRSGWPTIPPTYMGFRYGAQFRSAHFIESVITTDFLHEIDQRWPETSSPHFVYTLGPPMLPAKPMPLGKIYPNMRNWISLDLLLSGAASDYKQAIELMRHRNAVQDA